MRTYSSRTLAFRSPKTKGKGSVMPIQSCERGEGSSYLQMCEMRYREEGRKFVRAIQGRVERQEFSLCETVCSVDGIASVP